MNSVQKFMCLYSGYRYSMSYFSLLDSTSFCHVINEMKSKFLFSHDFISHQPTSRSSFMLNHFKAIFIENTFCCWNVECVRSAYNNTYNSCLHFYVNIIFLFFQTTQNIYFLNGENVEYINAWWAEARNICVYIFARKSISR